MQSDWANLAISKACITRPWADFIDSINAKIKIKISQQGYANFSELGQNEQNALIEREFFEVK